MRKTVLLLFLLLYGQLIFCQHTLRFDSSAVVKRQLSPAVMKRYADDADFVYDRGSAPVRSLWQKFWEYLWQQLDDILSTPGGRRMATVVVVGVSVLILIYFIIRLSGMSRAALFGKRTVTSPLAYSVSNEDIHGIDFDVAIRQAIERRDFKTGVRLLYLQSLKQLADLGLIDWKINKTNVTYVHEIIDSHRQQDFRRLTNQFENNWYGDREIGETEFNAVREQFNTFNTKIIAG